VRNFHAETGEGHAKVQQNLKEVSTHATRNDFNRNMPYPKVSGPSGGAWLSKITCMRIKKVRRNVKIQVT